MEVEMEDELVQYYVVNSDLNMSVGKIAGQVAHVADDYAERIINEKIFDYESYQLYRQWKHNFNQKKIILRGHKKDLEKLKEQNFYYIEDLGLTEIPAGSLTCVCLGVMWKSEAQQYIKRLQLL